MLESDIRSGSQRWNVSLVRSPHSHNCTTHWHSGADLPTQKQDENVSTLVIFYHTIQSIQPYSSEVTNIYLVNKPFLSRTTSSIFFSLRASGSMVNSQASSHTGFRLALTVSVFRFLTRSGRRRILTNGSGRSGCFAGKYNHFVQ